MNRLILVRHGGSTGNEDPAFYAYNDSAVCLTTNGIRQALTTATILAQIEPSWLKPGNFDLEVFASEYARAQQTCRIALDQMGLLSQQPGIRAVLNERNYGTVYDLQMDIDPAYAGNDSEPSIRTRVRVLGFLREIEPLLDRADVLAFSHFGTIRALNANLSGLSDAEMMTVDVPNGGIFLYERSFQDGQAVYTRAALSDPVIPKTAGLAAAPAVAPPPLLQ
jgi:broad specificity phosphatase PhoE